MADLLLPLDDIAAEVGRAGDKFGPQHHLPDLNPTVQLGQPGSAEAAAFVHGIRAALSAKATTDSRAARGTLSWADVLVEEVAEAIDAAATGTDPDALRAELVQVAAVVVRWIDALDARAATRGGQAHG